MKNENHTEGTETMKATIETADDREYSGNEMTAYLHAKTANDLAAAVRHLIAANLIDYADFPEERNLCAGRSITVFATKYEHADSKGEWIKDIRRSLKGKR